MSLRAGIQIQELSLQRQIATLQKENEDLRKELCKEQAKRGQLHVQLDDKSANDSNSTKNNDPDSYVDIVTHVSKQLEIRSEKRKDSFLLQVFNKYFTQDKISQENLQKAFSELNILKNKECQKALTALCSKENNTVTFLDFKQAITRPCLIESWVKTFPWWQGIADCILSRAGQEESSFQKLKALSSLEIEAICDVYQDFMRKTLTAEIGRLKVAETPPNTIRECQGTKFVQTKHQVGSLEDFGVSLIGRIGMASQRLFEAMESEHCSMPGYDFNFTTSDSKINTSPSKEWCYVVKGEQCPDSDMVNGRIIRSIDECMNSNTAKEANLTREEVIAVILFSGPMHELFNAILRGQPSFWCKVFQNNKFSTTLFVLTSAISKLMRTSKAQSHLVLYRSLNELPDKLLQYDRRRRRGCVELGFLCATSSQQVALAQVNCNQDHVTLLALETDSANRGAPISEFSQYPQEMEFVFPPASWYALTGDETIQCVPQEAPVRLLHARVTRNHKVLTVEELKQQKRRNHINMCQGMLKQLEADLFQCEDAFLARSSKDPSFHCAKCDLKTFVGAIVGECKAVLQTHEIAPPEAFQSDEKLCSMIEQTLLVRRMGLSKMELYLHNTAIPLCDVRQMPLREAFRQLALFLHHSIRHTQDPAQRSKRALQLCRAKGWLAQDSLERNERGESKLQEASADGWKDDDLSVLVSAGCEVNERNASGMTPVMLAAAYGHTRTIQALRALGADVSVKAKDGLTAVMVAAAGGYAETLRVLQALGADMSSATKDGRTAVFFAAAAGHTEIVQTLRALGADLAVCDGKGRNAVFAAAQGGHVDTIRLLHSQGARVDLADSKGQTAVMSAALAGHTEAVRVLHALGADIHGGNHEGLTAVIAAAIGGHTGTVEALHALGGDVRAVAKNGMTAVILAAAGGHTHTVRALHRLGGDVAAQDKVGQTAIMAAALGGYEDTVRALHALGADISGVDSFGQTPLIWAAIGGHTRTVRALCELGAAVNAADKEGQTALMEAAAEGHTDTVLALHALGAEVGAKDKGGRTAAMLAGAKGHDETCQILQALGGQRKRSK